MTTATLRAPSTSNVPPPLALRQLAATAARLLPRPAARWYRGLIRPSRVHLLETEDGQPRTVKFDGQAAGIAPCRTLLGGEDLKTPRATSADVCQECLAAAEALYGHDMLGGA